MTRIAWAAAQSASAAPQLKFRVLVDFQVTSSTLHCCTGVNQINWAGTIYSPVGNLGGMEQVTEAGDLFPRAIRLWLAAVTSAQLYEPLSENLFNKKVKLYRAFLNDGNTLVATPEVMFTGFVNQVHVHIGDKNKGNYYEVEVESRLRKEPRASRYNAQSMIMVHSGDTFFNYVDQIQGFQNGWGLGRSNFFTVPGNQERTPPTHPGRGRGG